MPWCRLSYGGSLIRPEATGYGLIYFLEEMVKENNDTLKVSQWYSLHAHALVCNCLVLSIVQ